MEDRGRQVMTRIARERRRREKRRRRRRRLLLAAAAAAVLFWLLAPGKGATEPSGPAYCPPGGGQEQGPGDGAADGEAEGGAAAETGETGERETPDYPPELADAFADLAEKNPEAREFVEGFTSVTDFDVTLDLSGELEPGLIPRLFQWDARWGYCRYGAGLMGWTGCGPTALSMVAMGLTGDGTLTPAAVAKFAVENGYCVEGRGTAWTLFSQGAASFGLAARELPLWEPTVRAELDAGRPVICVMGPGHFTDEGHYIVLTAFADGGYALLDPNRPSNCHVWLWEELEGEIRDLWSYERAPG